MILLSLNRSLFKLFFDDNNEFKQVGSDLFNGNISSTVTYTDLKALSGQSNIMANGYRYDILNRLVNNWAEPLGFVSNKYVWQAPSSTLSVSTAVSNYGENFSYDGNGNIMSLKRKNSTGYIDNLAYAYLGSVAATPTTAYLANTNRLTRVDDGIAGTAGYPQASPGTVPTFAYDAKGRLSSDATDQISDVKWTAFDKMKSLTHTASSTKPSLDFTYDPMGHRVFKKVSPVNTNSPKEGDYYHYEAGGNVSAITHYEERKEIFTASRVYYISCTNLDPLYCYNLMLTKDTRTYSNPVFFTFPSEILVSFGGSGNGYIWIEYVTPDNVTKRIYYKGIGASSNPTSGDTKYVINYDAAGILSATGSNYLDNTSLPNDTKVYAKKIEFVLNMGNNKNPNRIITPTNPNSTSASVPLTIYSYTPSQFIAYGSSRLGTYEVTAGSADDIIDKSKVRFELSDHLGNVRAVVSDVKDMTIPSAPKADIININNYYAYGMNISERTMVNVGGEYRFGFNGQEKTDEVAGLGNHNTAQYWEYDTRLGRRWNMDPVQFAGIAPYVTFADNPVLYSDVDGLEPGGGNKPKRGGQGQKMNTQSGNYVNGGDGKSGTGGKFVNGVGAALPNVNGKVNNPDNDEFSRNIHSQGAGYASAIWFKRKLEVLEKWLPGKAPEDHKTSGHVPGGFDGTKTNGATHGSSPLQSTESTEFIDYTVLYNMKTLAPAGGSPVGNTVEAVKVFGEVASTVIDMVQESKILSKIPKPDKPQEEFDVRDSIAPTGDIVTTTKKETIKRK